MADEIIITQVEYDTEEAEKNIDDLTRSIEGNNVALAQLKDQLKKGEISQVKFSKESAKIKVQLQDEKKQRNDVIKLMRTENQSREQLTKVIGKLIKERNKLNTGTEEGRKRAAELESQINSLNEQLVDSATETEKNKLSIGGYAKGILEAVPGVDTLKTSVSGFFKLLLTNPVGLIVAGLVLLFKLLQRFEPVTDALNKLWLQFNAVLEVLIGRVFKLAEAFWALIRLDFSGAADKAAEAFSGLGDEINNVIDSANRLAHIRVLIEKLTIDSTKSIARLNKIAEIQAAIADDATRSFQEREKAAEQARVTSEIAAAEQLRNTKIQVAAIQEEVKQAIAAGTINRKLRQEEADLIAAQTEAEKTLQLIELANEKRIRELKEARLERDLDILLDGFDNTKTINDRIIADDKRTLEERQAALDLITLEGEKSFNKQIETIRKFTKVRFDENELLKEQNAARLNERIRELGLSEIIEGRLLEIIRERRLVEAEQLEAKQILVDKEKETEQELSDFVDDLTEEDFKNFEENLENEEDALAKSEERKLKLIEDAAKKQTAIQKAENQKQLTNAVSFGAQLGVLLTDTIQDSEKGLKDFFRGLSLLILESLKRTLISSIAEIAIKDIATKGFAGVATAAAKIALVTAAFETAKRGLSSFGLGGRVPMAARGAKFGTFSGASHAGGGIDLFTSSGQAVANVEGNENFYVLKKDASAQINALSAINQAYGGVSLTGGHKTKMQEGGQANIPENQQIEITETVRQILRETKFVVQVEDIKTGMQDVDEVVSVGVI